MTALEDYVKEEYSTAWGDLCWEISLIQLRADAEEDLPVPPAVLARPHTRVLCEDPLQVSPRQAGPPLAA